MSAFVRWGDNIRPVVQRPIMRRLITSRRWGRALDAGCGRGLYTPDLALAADAVDAIDLNPSHVEAHKRRHLQSNVSVHMGSVTALPFGEDTFDLVLLSEVLEHIVDDRAALGEIVRVLRPEGYLLISVPHPPAPIEDHEHVREGYSRKEIENLLLSCGFNVVAVDKCMYGISKTIIKFESWWTAHVSRFTPAPAYWLLYIERLLSIKLGSPYDIIILAQHRVSADALYQKM